MVAGAMSAIFHLPKSTKFESFQMFYSSLQIILLKELQQHLTVIISFGSYCENSLKALTRERRKGDYLNVQYDVTESTDMSNASTKELLPHEKTKQGLTQFLEKQDINHLKNQNISFAVAGNDKTHLKNSNGTVHCC